MLRRRGFTLIELLVVIAIIGILAAMLFPVFARARESARKIQCLSNVKNIAMAIQMYLTDYDALTPLETRQEIIDWYASNKSDCWDGPTRQNPYLKVPVILDEYIKNRDVWRCPSSRSTLAGGILPPGPTGDFWDYARTSMEAGCNYALAMCNWVYPPGWGGTVTDSYVQHLCQDSGGPGAFHPGDLNAEELNWGRKLSSIPDPARWVAVSEGSKNWDSAMLAFPDACKAGCATTIVEPLNPNQSSDSDCQAYRIDWEACSWTRDCSIDSNRFGSDVNYRKEWTRHMGGDNLGFMDGHAKWFAAEAILTGGPDNRPNRAKPPIPPIFDGPASLCRFPDV